MSSAAAPTTRAASPANRPATPSRLNAPPPGKTAFAQALLGGRPPKPVAPKPASPKPASPGAPPALPHDHTSPHAKVRPGAEEIDHGARAKRPDADPLDPETRRCAQLGPPAFTPAAPVAATAPADEIAPRARVSMEELLPQLVKRIAWAGDRHRGSVQMELGSGPHSGTVVTVHADGGRVRVELQGDAGGALRQRLESRGFTVER